MEVFGEPVVHVVDKMMFARRQHGEHTAGPASQVRQTRALGSSQFTPKLLDSSWDTPPPPMEPNAHRSRSISDVSSFSSVSVLGFYPIRERALCVLKSPSSGVLALVTSCGWIIGDVISALLVQIVVLKRGCLLLEFICCI